MASIAKGVSLGGFNTRGIGLTVLVVVLIAALFFIPEIIEFQRGLSSDREVQIANNVDVSDVEETPTERHESIEVPAVETDGRISVSQDTIVDRVLRYFKSDSGKTPIELSKESEAAKAWNWDTARREAKTKGAPFTVESVTWSAIKSTESSVHLNKAATEALNIARALPKSNNETIYALYNYVSGIRFILGSAEKSMNAKQAFSYLEQLDTQVTEAMSLEKISASEFNNWSRISLGPVFASSRVLQDKAVHQKPFNPSLTIVGAKIIQPGTSDRKFKPYGKAVLNVAAAIRGTDIARVELYRNDQKLPNRRLRQPDANGISYIFIRGSDARGIYTFRIFDKSNQFYTKSYNFYDKARMYPWIAKKQGRFAIPFSDYDPRLDKLFMYKQPTVTRDSDISYFTSTMGAEFKTF